MTIYFSTELPSGAKPGSHLQFTKQWRQLDWAYCEIEETETQNTYRFEMVCLVSVDGKQLLLTTSTPDKGSDHPEDFFYVFGLENDGTLSILSPLALEGHFDLLAAAVARPDRLETIANKFDLAEYDSSWR